jgi:hypothetical protein
MNPVEGSSNALVTLLAFVAAFYAWPPLFDATAPFMVETATQLYGGRDDIAGYTSIGWRVVLFLLIFNVARLGLGMVMIFFLMGSMRFVTFAF